MEGEDADGEAGGDGLVDGGAVGEGEVALGDGRCRPFGGRGELEAVGIVGDLAAVEAVVFPVVGEEVIAFEEEEFEGIGAASMPRWGWG